jgi:hypothetical protein
MLEHVAQVFIGREAKQLAATTEQGRKLEIRQISAPVGAPQPILFLGEIVVADAGAVQGA